MTVRGTRKVIESPITAPFAVVIDTREQRPFEFKSLRSDAAQGKRPIVVPTVRGCLAAGDYSLNEPVGLVSIERKSLGDLFGTLAHGRARFERELDRLRDFARAYIVVEADWSQVFRDPPRHSDLNPKTVYRSVLAWQHRFPRVQWWFCPGRAFAEVTTFRILERAWKDHAQTAKGGD